MSIADYWRLEAPRFRLEATKCEKCEKLYFPPKVVCPQCGNKELKKVEISGKGKLISFSRIDKPADEHTYVAPYYVGIIELEEGIRLSGSLVDLGDKEPEEGMKVEIAFRKYYPVGDEGVIYYGYKFRPLLMSLED